MGSIRVARTAADSAFTDAGFVDEKVTAADGEVH